MSGAELCVDLRNRRSGDPAHGRAPASMLWWEAELSERVAADDRFVIRDEQVHVLPPGWPGYSSLT